MPFDPRLIHPDEPPLRADGELDLPDEPPLRADGELDLPADLAALSEQLGDDAAHLSACYPADRAPQVALAAELVQSASRIKRHSWFRSAAVVGTGLATVAALGISLVIAARQSPDTSGPSRPVAIAPVPASERALPVDAALVDPLPSAPTLSVGELSGPELEALLDLLNGEPQSVASISF